MTRLSWLACCAFVVACSSGGSAASDAGSQSDTGAVGADATAGTDASGDGSAPVDAASADSGGSEDGDGGDAGSPLRNPLVQPFASTSIWNMPIGSGATYVDANIAAATGTTLEGDEDVIVLTPTAAPTDIYRNTADWNPNVSRCPYDAGALLFSAPMPASFVVGDTPTSDTPNSGLAVLLPDLATVKQTQPFARCTAGTPATSDYLFPDVSLYGDGIPGAHGGSGLSAIGGTLRVGELRPGGPPPHHALKLELWAAKNYYNDGNQADCFHWPATDCDGYFNDSTSPLKYGGTNPALGPGALLALPVSVSIVSLGLTTEPAKNLAWTLQNYGAYLVDDTAWSATAICIEHGPAGSFAAQFQSDYGFALDPGGSSGAFAKDIATLVAALAVVDDNGPNAIGGGGTPLQPLALPLPPAPPASVDP
jgi:hypothetical protein